MPYREPWKPWLSIASVLLSFGMPVLHYLLRDHPWWYRIASLVAPANCVLEWVWPYLRSYLGLDIGGLFCLLVLAGVFNATVYHWLLQQYVTARGGNLQSATVRCTLRTYGSDQTADVSTACGRRRGGFHAKPGGERAGGVEHPATPLSMPADIEGRWLRFATRSHS